MDFGRFIAENQRTFTRFPEVLAKYQDRFRYISLVDEYQDINHSQYLIVKALASNLKIFMVGDDAQSIYSFRGRISIIFQFQKDYPDVVTVALEQNYCSNSKYCECC